MDRTETHPGVVGAGMHMPEVKPATARRIRATDSPASDGPQKTLAAACEAICGVFMGQADDVDAWLGNACTLVLRLLAETAEVEDVRGVWAALIDDPEWRRQGAPFVGVAGFVDEIEREEVRARARERVREEAPRNWSARRVPDRAWLEAPEWVRGIGTLGAAVADGQGSEALLLLGVRVGGVGAAVEADVTPEALGPASRTVWEAMTKAAGERIIRPRAARRRLVRGLSGAQQQVLELLIEGITEHEIACRLGRSRHTVHDHVRTIYKTLGLSSKAELITAWNDAGRR